MANYTSNSFKTAFIGEYIKLYQAKGSKILIIILGIAILISGLLLSDTFNPIDQSFFIKVNSINLALCPILFAILGCTNSTNEYHFNTINITLLSVNSRRNVILAKTLLLAIVSFLISLLTLIITTILAYFMHVSGNNDSHISIINSAVIHEYIFSHIYCPVHHCEF